MSRQHLERVKQEKKSKDQVVKVVSVKETERSSSAEGGK